MIRVMTSFLVVLEPPFGAFPLPLPARNRSGMVCTTGDVDGVVSFGAAGGICGVVMPGAGITGFNGFCAGGVIGRGCIGGCGGVGGIDGAGVGGVGAGGVVGVVDSNIGVVVSGCLTKLID